MQIGNIILIPFPFSDFTTTKVRPAVVICQTKDKYQDLVLCAISSVVPNNLLENEILLQPNNINQLRAISIIKVDRIITTKKEFIIHKLGILKKKELEVLKLKFSSLID
jgi:mRNA interferase MazF